MNRNKELAKNAAYLTIGKISTQCNILPKTAGPHPGLKVIRLPRIMKCGRQTVCGILRHESTSSEVLCFGGLFYELGRIYPSGGIQI